jgi:putative transposase
MSEYKHLCRLGRVWTANPRYFVTICTEKRRAILADEHIVSVLRREWKSALERHGWAVGSYTVMPDHVHFFCTDGGSRTTLSEFIGKWKEWTAKAMKREAGLDVRIWQKSFFDHLLRSSESYSEKWDYVRNNPVRAGLVAQPDDWPYSGHIHYL